MTPTPINSNIPLEGKPVQIPNALDQYAKVQEIQAGQQNMALRQQQLANETLSNQANTLNLGLAQKDVAGMSKEAELWKANPNDPDAVAQGLVDANFPKQAMDFRARQLAAKKSQLDQQEQAITIHKGNLDIWQKQVDQFGEIANPVINAALGIGDDGQPVAPLPGQTAKPFDLKAYDQVYRSAYSQGVAANLIDPNTKPGDPNYLPPTGLNADGSLNLGALRAIRGHAATAVTAQQNITNEQNHGDFMLKVINANRDIVKDAPDTAEKWTNYAGKVLGAAANKDEWAVGLQTLQAAGMPPSMMAGYDKTFIADTDETDGSATRAANMATSPIQRSTEAHQAAQEKIAQGRLDVMDKREQRIDATLGVLAQERETRIANEAIDKSKEKSEANILKNRSAEVARVLKTGDFDTEDEVTDTLAKPVGKRAGTVSDQTHAAAQTAQDAIQGINGRYAPQMQAVGDKYADAVDKQAKTPGTATRFDYDPKTMRATPRTSAAAPTAKGNGPASTMTEQDVRDKANAAGVDADWMVAQSRAKGFIK